MDPSKKDLIEKVFGKLIIERLEETYDECERAGDWAPWFRLKQELAVLDAAIMQQAREKG